MKVVAIIIIVIGLLVLLIQPGAGLALLVLGLVLLGADNWFKKGLKAKEALAAAQTKPQPQLPPNTAEANELRLRRTQAAIHLADITAKMMKVQMTATKVLSKEQLKSDEITEPAMAFGCGLLLTALNLRGIDFSQEAMGESGPRLVLVHFLNQWLGGNREELADYMAHMGAKPELEKYVKFGEIAFRRFDTEINDTIPDEDFAKHNDDFARALGVV